MQGQVSKRAQTSENFAGDLRVPERTQANHEEMNFHFSRPHTALSILLLDEIYLMNCDVIFFTDEVYEFVSCTNSSAG